MGIFYSQCYSCGGRISWFLRCEGGLICKRCGILNDEDHVWFSMDYDRKHNFGTEEECLFIWDKHSAEAWDISKYLTGPKPYE